MPRNIRGRVRPGRGTTLVGMIVGIGMFGFGLVMLGQMGGPASGPGGLGGAFMLVWLVATLGITAFHGYNFFSERGAAVMEVDLETGMSHDGSGGDGPWASGSGADFESRLRQLVRLREDGLITEEEFQRKRAEIMKSKW